MRFLISACLVVFGFLNLEAQLHWESMVLETDNFNYLIPDSEPASDWMQSDFNDQDWSSAIGGFGYADRDDNTSVPYGTPSVYLRKSIKVPSSLTISQLLLDIDYDDAFVAYVNGEEVARSVNLLEGTPARLGSVTSDREAIMYRGNNPERYTLDPTILKSGENILAVHIMNISDQSSDMSGRVFLHAEIDSNDLVYQSTPDWFIAPQGPLKSNLPIVKINTQGDFIRDEPKIEVILQVIDNEDGLNDFTDTSYTYNGYAGIEIRGFTSQNFPKKGYGLETRLEDGENNNLEILGMPAENDWVLHGPYSDKSLMRNALAYHLGNSFGLGWHPRTEFIELVINGEYQGIYLFTEKIKIDKNRVDIARLNPEDTVGDQLTGGYIISIDRDQYGSWNSPYMGRTGSVDVPFSYVDPKYDEMSDHQRNYIREYVTNFEHALNGANYRDPDLGYRPYIDVKSFIDYFIITEVARDLDGYRVSVFFHKDKDSKGGRLKMTPFWDYNICFGNGNFFGAGDTNGWTADGIGRGDAYEVPFWWDRFRSDPYFESMIKYRWQELRQGPLNIDSLNTYIDSVANHLSEAQVRNFERWNILSNWVWPNNFVGGSYENEIWYLKSWIEQRITWLDSQINAINELNLSTPLVQTVDAEVINKDSVIISGQLLDDGNAAIWHQGFYWSNKPNAITTGEREKLWSGEPNFEVVLSDLKADRTYYYVAYAENDRGISYGEEQSFYVDESTILNSPNDNSRFNAFPNPFSETLKIAFSLEGDQKVNITLTNVMGQIVAEKSMVGSGLSEVEFSGEELSNASGLLFYKVSTEGKVIHSGKVLRSFGNR